MASDAIIIGHQKPDTDSIVAAISYAYLKNKIKNGGFVAARCGEINHETRFVLDHFGVPAPCYVADVRARVEDVLDGVLLFISPETTIRQAGVFMRQHGVKTLAVADGDRQLLGILTVGDLALLFLEAWDSGYLPMDMTVKNVMRKDRLVTFHTDDLVKEVRRTMLETRFRNYPVVDDQNRFCGMISRYHLLASRGKPVILVDHNEKSQAVPGIEQAEIIEIVDHHRIANIETAEPIPVRNEPVGSTATIISKMFSEQQVEPPVEIAGLLCAAILSDTMLLKSPTATGEDKDHMERLAGRAGIEPIEFGRLMFRAGSLLTDLSCRDIVLEDFKEFYFGQVAAGIGQVEIVDKEALPVEQEELLVCLNAICRERGYDLAVMMITDLTLGGSEVAFCGNKSRAFRKAFGIPDDRFSFFLPGVVSRKKQVVPPMRRLLQE